MVGREETRSCSNREQRVLLVSTSDRNDEERSDEQIGDELTAVQLSRRRVYLGTAAMSEKAVFIYVSRVESCFEGSSHHGAPRSGQREELHLTALISWQHWIRGLPFQMCRHATDCLTRAAFRVSEKHVARTLCSASSPNTFI